MAPMFEALLVFVGLPTLAVAAVAALVASAVAAVRRLTAAPAPVVAPGTVHVVAFPSRRGTPVRTVEDAPVRRAA